MKKLLAGILRFRENISPEGRDRFAKLALGQSPDSLLIACSDSRVAPNVFASTDPGDLFVTRNVGNMVPPHDQGHAEQAAVAAAVDFAVSFLKVSDAIVCGHSQCGAMAALLGLVPGVLSPGLRSWLIHGEEALERLSAGKASGVSRGSPADSLVAAQLGDGWWSFKGDPARSVQDGLSQVNVLVQLEHLLSSPIVRDAVTTRGLRLHGWWFDIGAAEVLAWDPAAARFLPIDEDHAGRILERLG